MFTLESEAFTKEILDHTHSESCADDCELCALFSAAVRGETLDEV